MSSTRLRPPGPGAQARLRPAGFDARAHRPSSLRAQAQRVYREEAEQDAVLKRPLPDAPPQAGEGNGKEAGREQAAPVQASQTELTRQVRALYEAGVVPVREIARLAGVSERTLYKYVQKGGWRRRYPVRGAEAAAANRGRRHGPRTRPPPKGTGGRFIRSEDRGKPVRRGLKALDPAGEARALSRSACAAALSREAAFRARRLRETLSDARVLSMLVGVLRDLAAIEQADRPAAAAKPEIDMAAARRELSRRIDALVAQDDDAKRRPATSPGAPAAAPQPRIRIG